MSELSTHDKAVLTAVFNPNLPLCEVYEEENIEIEDDNEEVCPELIKSKKLELEAVSSAESGNLDNALNLLNEAIQKMPTRPSLYNNRAQVYQFQQLFEDAFRDLSKAIELCGQKYKKTKCQAYCQRGLLYRRSKNDNMARNDFEEAAKLGSKFAKGQLVELNPYAAMCNAMLKEVMGKLSN